MSAANGQIWPTSPVMLRVDLLYRFAFEKTPNRLGNRRRRHGESAVYLPYARRERRYVACMARSMREAMGDENYEALLFVLDSSNYPTLDADPVARHVGLVEGVPPCTDGPRCADHGLLTHGR